jgi:S-DNA-T family DNA segregation ATPase FtsK/SpoIIIE
VPGDGCSQEIAVAAPPLLAAPSATAWLAVLLPVAGSAGSVGFVLLLPGSRSLLPVALLGGTVLLSLGLGLAARWRERHARRRQRDRYRAYLGTIRGRLDELAAAQRDAAEFLLPDLARLLALAGRPERRWERRPSDRDFLTARVGRGPVPLACPVRLESGGPLADHDPELLAEAEELVGRAAALAGMPVAVDLRGLGVLAVGGTPERARALVRALLCHLAVLHAPDDLRILAGTCGRGGAAAWDGLKWLPHTRPPSTQAPGCLLAPDPAGLAALLDRELGHRLERHAGQVAAPPVPAGGDEPPGPHLLVVLDRFSPSTRTARLPAVRELLTRAPELGATVLCLVAGRADEPAELRARVVVDAAGDLAYEEAGPDGRRLEGVRADQCGLALGEAVARRLAPVRLEPRGGLAALPDEVRLLDLPGPDRVDLAAPGEGWRPRPRSELLRVPIGVREGGEPVLLDLKEAADGGMGPHGLVIGATGAGKSELLRSLVVGLALAHPPEVLSFVLVDFKGGAAFADLAGLPHSGGLVTNLRGDLAMVDRVRAALQGELERRQRLLRQAGNLDGIAQYQARRAVDRGLPPMPYLVVVVDEFGELLASRPDFLDLLVAAGRVGRSLGVHLVLASQRLDEGRIRGLESHLRYRVCLRTFSPSESASVLGTPDAYHLPPAPGLAWLKVDSTVYHRFKGALVTCARRGQAAPGGAATVLPFDPLRTAAGGPAGPPATALAGVEETGGGPGTGAPATDGPEGAGRAAAPDRHAPAANDQARRGGPPPGGRAADLPDPATDMEAAVAALAAEGRRAGQAAHQVWLPPLAGSIPLAQVLAWPLAAGGVAAPGGAGWLRVPVGMVDEPLAQAQRPLLLDFSGAAGHLAVIGAPRSGKSTLLGTLAAAFALTHAPEDVQLYAIDLGGGLLHQLTRLPHVGAVCAPGELDRMRRLVRELRAVVAEREAGFRRHGVGSMATWHAQRHDQAGYGEVFLLVDGWALLRRQAEDLEAEIGELVATGLHYGVHVVVAANRWADLRPALRDNLGGRLELRLNDPVESEVGRAASAGLPARPGSGLTPAGLEFQAALPAVGDAGDLDGGVATLAAGAVAGRAAPRLRLLPPLVRADALPRPSPGQPPGVPFAVDEHRLEPVRLDLLGGQPHFLVLGDGGCGKTGLLRLVAGGLADRYPPERVQLILVDYRRTLIDLAAGPHLAGYACTAGMTADLVGLLGPVLAERLPSAALSRAQLAARDWWSGPHYVLVVDDYDLVLTAAGSPLAPLVDLLGQGRDVGLHLVLARPVSGTARTSFEPVFQRVRELGTPGLVMRGDPQEGPVLGGRKAGPQPPGRGHLVRRDGPDRLVQVAWAPPGRWRAPGNGRPDLPDRAARSAAVDA